MDAHTRSMAALAVILAMMASMIFAESSAVTASVESSASSDGSTSTSSSVVTEGSGASGSAVSTARSGSNASTHVSTSQSTSVGTGSGSMDAMAAAHFDHLSAIVDDLETFGFDAALVAEARSELAEEKQAWSDADTEDGRRAVVARMNAYWSDLRDRVRASGVSYDFDVEFGASSAGGITVVSSSSGSGVISSSGDTADATLNPVFNTADDAPDMQRAESRSSTGVDGVIQGAAGVASFIGAMVNAWINAIIRLF